jgi:hypothetical protein
MRGVFIVGLIAIVTAASVDAGACGDKFLRVGRSSRFRRYAAVHPATILIYKPAGSTPAGIEALKAILKQAGHKPVAIDNGTGFLGAVTAAEYDVVIADYGDAPQIRRDLQSSASKPALLPILYKPTKAVEAEAEKQYVCLIKPHAMTKYDALAEIDRLMQLKLAGGPTAITK